MFFHMEKALIVMYFISAGGKPKKANRCNHKSNLDVLKKIEVRYAYSFPNCTAEIEKEKETFSMFSLVEIE